MGVGWDRKPKENRSSPNPVTGDEVLPGVRELYSVKITLHKTKSQTQILVMLVCRPGEEGPSEGPPLSTDPSPIVLPVIYVTSSGL